MFTLMCVPCRAENNVFTVHCVIFYLSQICLSQSLILALCSFSLRLLSFLSCQALSPLSLPFCLVLLMLITFHPCACAEHGPLSVKNAVSCLFSEKRAALVSCCPSGEQLGVTMNQVPTKKLVTTSKDWSTTLR